MKITTAQYKAMTKGVGGSKYKAIRTQHGGRVYDSKAEADYARRLDEWREEGLVEWVLPQVTIPLGPDFSTRVDFLVEHLGQPRLVLGKETSRTEVIAVEVKGYETPRFRKIKKLWRKYGPFPLWVVKQGKIEEIITGGGSDG